MQGRLDMKVGQISGITTFTPGLNCPLPVNLIPNKVDSIAKLQQTNRSEALLKAIFTLLLRYYSIIKNQERQVQPAYNTFNHKYCQNRSLKRRKGNRVHNSLAFSYVQLWVRLMHKGETLTRRQRHKLIGRDRKTHWARDESEMRWRERSLLKSVMPW